MQLLHGGRLRVERTFTYNGPEGEFKLCELASGAFQLGDGPDSKVVTSTDDVSRFFPEQVPLVEAWLAKGGAQAAVQERTAQFIQDRAESGPGTLDASLALLEQKVPGVRGQILSLVTQALVENGLIAQPGTSAPSDLALPATPRQSLEMTDEEEARLLRKAGVDLSHGGPRRFSEVEAARIASQPDVPDHSGEVLAAVGGPNPATAEGHAQQMGRLTPKPRRR